MIHPAMALRYRKAVTGLRKLLKDGQANEAKEHVRALIEKIVLIPKEGEGHKELSIDLYGDLAGILKIATEGKIMTKTGVLTKRLEKDAANDNILFEPSVQLVAGAGNQRYLPLITARNITASENHLCSGQEVCHE